MTEVPCGWKILCPRLRVGAWDMTAETSVRPKLLRVQLTSSSSREELLVCSFSVNGQVVSPF